MSEHCEGCVESESRTGFLSADYCKGFADGQAVLKPGEPYREHLVQQAENINQDGLQKALVWMGVACAGSGQEGFSAHLAENVNRLIRAALPKAAKD